MHPFGILDVDMRARAARGRQCIFSLHVPDELMVERREREDVAAGNRDEPRRSVEASDEILPQLIHRGQPGTTVVPARRFSLLLRTMSRALAATDDTLYTWENS